MGLRTFIAVELPAPVRETLAQVCLQLAACVPNFLIQEHFDAFNDPWTRDLVSWSPEVREGRLTLPSDPGLGIELDLEVARAHPYDPSAFLNIHQKG